MSEDNENIDVVVENDKKEEKNEPKIEVVDEAPKVEAKKGDIEPEEGIQNLKKRLEMEKRAREDAERRAVEAHIHAQKAQGDTVEAQYQLVQNAIETIKSRSDTLKVAFRDAYNVGDTDKMAEIQEAIAINTNQLEKLKDGEKAIKKQIKSAEEGSRQIHHGSAVDQLIANVAPESPRSAAWLNESRDYLRDERSIRKMFRAHEDAIDDGIKPDTDEYFEFIETRMGINRQQYRDVANEEAIDNPLSSASQATHKRSVSPPPAPVSRGNGQRANVIRLTRDQADMAKMMGMSESDYAKNMLALQKEGKLSH